MLISFSFWLFNRFDNRDDHAKNFCRIHDPKNDCRHPSPAYDLTWSTACYDEHTTTANGNGRDPGMKELLAVGKSVGMGQKVCKQIAEDIRQKTSTLVEKYQGFLSQHPTDPLNKGMHTFSS